MSLHATAGVAKQVKTSSVFSKCVRRGDVTYWPRHWPHMYTWGRRRGTEQTPEPRTLVESLPNWNEIRLFPLAYLPALGLGC